MYNFVIENRNVNDQSVTGTYMNIVKNACSQIGETKTILNGEMPKHKAEYVISDMVQTSFKYFCRGCRHQIVWMQGIVPEESYMRRHSKLRFAVLSFMERYVLKHSKLLLLVSEDMLHHYEAKYKLSLKEKSVIMPCFNETKLVEGAFSDEKYRYNTFLYVGGLAKWQCFEQMAALYSKIEKRAADDTMFYIYTFHREAARAVIEQYDIKHYKIDYAPKEELSEKIKGMKYGFVLRENCAVNNVATPTKFSNYLANGIIPIYSDSLKSFASIDRDYDLGIVCNSDDLESGAERILQHMKTSIVADELKNKCQQIFDTYYNPNGYIEMLRKKLMTL